MNSCVSKEELELALKQLNIAIENGFKDSKAVLRVYTGGETLSDFNSRYNSIILKAHPTDENLDWGSTNHPEWFKFVDGKLVDN